MADRPDLVAAVTDPASVPVDMIPTVIGELARMQAVLWSRLAAPLPANGSGEDRLLTIDQAAARMAVTPDWLRRRPTLPFVAKLSDGIVRYSERELERFSRQHLPGR